MLLCERVGDCTGRCESELDEDLTERLAGPILLRERLRQLVGGQDPLFDHQLAELASVVVGRFHGSSIGLEGPRLKALRALPGKRPEHEREPVHADHVGLDPQHENRARARRRATEHGGA